MVNHFIDNLFPHLSPRRRAVARSPANGRGSPLGGMIVCRKCQSKFVSYQQLTNHQRKEGGCIPVRSSASITATSTSTQVPPSSPLRQFNAFDASSHPLSPIPDPLTPPHIVNQDAAGTGSSEEADTSYHHLISPEPRTSALGQQVGARFEQIPPCDGSSTFASEDLAEEKRQEVVAFIKNCNGGRGLSRKDQNWLLSFAEIPGLKNDKDVQKHIDTLPRPVRPRRDTISCEPDSVLAACRPRKTRERL
jgi:hypothetical protein